MPHETSSSKPKKWTFFTLLGVVCFCWVIEIADWITPFLSFDGFGIRPRNLFGLIGIPLSPFLHIGFSHLMANTLPFLILGYIVLKAEKIHFYTASVMITLLGGLGTWLIAGPSEVHVGASGLIYGYFGYVMIRGFMEGRIKWVLTGVFTALFFGGMIFGVFPSESSLISWEGHLCGMIAGSWFGYKRVKRKSF